MRIHLENPSVNALLLCGVPFAQGAVHSGSGLALQEPDGNRLPLWWTERALWPAVRFEKIHSLTYLLDLCEEQEPGYASVRERAETLTPYAVENALSGSGKNNLT